MTGVLDYDGPLQFEIIKIDDRKKPGVRKNFKHQVKYFGELNDTYSDEWLFLDTEKMKYTAGDTNAPYTRDILKVIEQTMYQEY